MQELLLAVARGLVDDKDAVSVTVDAPREDGTIVYHLSVAENDMGRVIGKQGRIAKAIRVVMRAAAVRKGEKVMVEIDWPSGAQNHKNRAACQLLCKGPCFLLGRCGIAPHKRRETRCSSIWKSARP